MARRKPTKTLRPKPARPKVRIHTTPKLTRSEFEKLQARAAAEARSVANYVAFLLVQPLKGKGRRKLRLLPASRSGDDPGPEGRARSQGAEADAVGVELRGVGDCGESTGLAVSNGRQYANAERAAGAIV